VVIAELFLLGLELRGESVSLLMQSLEMQHERANDEEAKHNASTACNAECGN